MKICRPLKRQMSLQQTKGALAAVLVVALAFAIPAPIVYGLRTTVTGDPDVHGHDCSTNDSVRDTAFPLAYNSILFLAFLLILVALTIIYVRIWREMQRHNRYMARNSDANIGKFYLASTSEVSSASELTAVDPRARQSFAPCRDSGKNVNDEAFSGPGQIWLTSRENSPGKLDRGGGGDGGGGDGKNHKCPSVQSDSTYCEMDPEADGACVAERTAESDGVTFQDSADTTRGLRDVLGSERSVQGVYDSEMSLQDVFDAQDSVQGVYDTNSNVWGVHDKEQRVQGVYDSKRSVQDVSDKEQSAPPQRSYSEVFEGAVDSPLDEDVESSFTPDNKDCTPEKRVEATSVFTFEDTHDCDKTKRKLRNDTDVCDKTSSDNLTTKTGPENEPRQSEHGAPHSHEAQSCRSPEGQQNAEYLHSSNGSVGADVGSRRGERDTTQPKPPDNETETGGSANLGCTDKSEVLAPPLRSPSKLSVSVSPPAKSPSKLSVNVSPPAKSPSKQSVSVSPPAKPPSRSQTANGKDSQTEKLHSDGVVASAVPRRREKAVMKRLKSRKATTIAMSVTVVFFLSFLPHLSLITARIVHTDFDKSLRGAALVFYNIFLRSYFINSVANPIIYGVQNARFRAECHRLFREIVSCKRHRAIMSDS